MSYLLNLMKTFCLYNFNRVHSRLGKRLRKAKVSPHACTLLQATPLNGSSNAAPVTPRLKMDFKNIKAVIFDFDGTLYDFKGVTKNLLKNLSILSIIRAGKERKLRHIYKGKYFGSSE